MVLWFVFQRSLHKLCQIWNLWIHKRCSGVKGKLKKEQMFICKKCKGEGAPPNSLNSTQVHINEDTIQALPTFQYLGKLIGESGGCVDATHAHSTAAWKGFRKLLKIITNRGILLRNQANIFSSCIKNACCMVAKHGQGLAKQYIT